MTIRRMEPETRRKLIAEALLAVAARDGLEAVTVRDVAAEAGVSAGMVQHHFRSRDQMLLFACRHLVARTARRLGERIAALSEPQTMRPVLQTILADLVPVDDDRRSEVRVWIAMLARAVVQEDLSAFMRETHEASHRAIVDTLREGQRRGEVGADIDADREAVGLFALAEGLVSHVQIGHYTAEQAMRAIDDQLGALFDER